MKFSPVLSSSFPFRPNLLLRFLSSIKTRWHYWRGFSCTQATGCNWTYLIPIVKAVLEGLRYYLNRENGRFLSVPLWWRGQYRQPPLQSQHVLPTSSNNWITTRLVVVPIHISRFSRDLSIMARVMESTSGWQRFHSRQVNCVFTPVSWFLLALDFRWKYSTVT